MSSLDLLQRGGLAASFFIGARDHDIIKQQVQTGRNMPRVFGQSQIHVNEVSALVENHVPLIEAGVAEPSAEGRAIGNLLAPMVPDGATIQLGVGTQVRWRRKGRSCLCGPPLRMRVAPGLPDVGV
jgi:hypothetical protein